MTSASRPPNAIRQSEHELRVVTDQLPTLISYIDPEGRFLRVNQTYERWTGLAPAADHRSHHP